MVIKKVFLVLLVELFLFIWGFKKVIVVFMVWVDCNIKGNCICLELNSFFIIFMLFNK